MKTGRGYGVGRPGGAECEFVAVSTSDGSSDRLTGLEAEPGMSRTTPHGASALKASLGTSPTVQFSNSWAYVFLSPFVVELFQLLQKQDNKSDEIMF